jgi:hypothetical protein
MKVTLNERADSLPVGSPCGVCSFSSFRTIIDTYKQLGLIRRDAEVIEINVEPNGITFVYK